MNQKQKELLKEAEEEISKASTELALAAQDYESRRKKAQTRITIASSRLSAIISTLE